MRKLAIVLGIVVVAASCAARRRTTIIQREGPAGVTTTVVHKHGPGCGHVFRNGGWVVVRRAR